MPSRFIKIVKPVSKTRTFVALPLADDLCLRAKGLIDRLQPHAPQAQWVEEEKLHLTLLFLGDLVDSEIAETCSRVDWAARANEPFSIRLAGARTFPDMARPRALWLGVTEGSGPLCRLQADLDEALADFVPRKENRAYIPHLTLARLARNSRQSKNFPDVIAGLSDYDAGTMHVDQVTVFASELRRGGPEYQPLATCSLGRPG